MHIKKKRVNINSELRVLSKNKNKQYKLIVDNQNYEYFLNKKVGDVVQYHGDEFTIILIF